MWKFNGEEILDISQFPKDAYGFIYMIKCEGMYYVGQKRLRTKRKRRFGKKEIAKMTDKRKKTWEYVVKESNWRTYTGSNKMLNNLIGGGAKFQKVILRVCYSSKELTYEEAKCQIMMDVLKDENSFNDNILGKFFRADFDN